MTEDYDGTEIFFFDVGHGDSILVRNWEEGEPTLVLIDGGNRENADDIASSLSDLEIDHIDHVVCSHFHQDHAGGLIELLNEEVFTLDHGWMHLPEKHEDVDMAALHAALAKVDKEYSDEFKASLNDADDLEDAFRNRDIEDLKEPFQGAEVAFLHCLGPTEEFYEDMLRRHRDTEAIQQYHKLYRSYRRDREKYELKAQGGRDGPDWPEERYATPANNTSTIFEVEAVDKRSVLTADAGVEGITLADDYCSLDDLHFIQIPHHGSHHYLTPELVRKFDVQIAYVSALGDETHPAECVVDEFQETEAKVYSTHWTSSKRRKFGSVPDIDWKDAEALPDDWSQGQDKSD